MQQYASHLLFHSSCPLHACIPRHPSPSAHSLSNPTDEHTQWLASRSFMYTCMLACGRHVAYSLQSHVDAYPSQLRSKSLEVTSTSLGGSNREQSSSAGAASSGCCSLFWWDKTSTQHHDDDPDPATFGISQQALLIPPETGGCMVGLHDRAQPLAAEIQLRSPAIPHLALQQESSTH